MLYSSIFFSFQYWKIEIERGFSGLINFNKLKYHSSKKLWSLSFKKYCFYFNVSAIAQRCETFFQFFCFPPKFFLSKNYDFCLELLVSFRNFWISSKMFILVSSKNFVLFCSQNVWFPSKIFGFLLRHYLLSFQNWRKPPPLALILW